MGVLKRVVAFVLCMVLTLSVMTVSASATSKNTPKVIENFGAKTEIRWEHYDAMRTGKISAVKQKGVWYYKFEGKKATVLVNVAAFSGEVENDFTKVNDSLTEGVMASGVPNVRSFTYKERVDASDRVVTTSSGRSVKRQTVKTYTTYFSYLTMTGSRLKTDIELECKKNGHVQFEYSDMVSGKAWFKNGYIKPSTAAQYVAALKRTTSDKISTKITPVFKAEITVPGSNCVYFYSVEYKGRGDLGKTKNVLELIEVAATTAKVTANMSTGKLAFEDLVSLASGMAKVLMVEDSEDYTSDDIIFLTGKFNGKMKYTMKSEFTSPIGLRQIDDYFRAEVRVNEEFSTSKTKTQVKVTFSVE